MKVTAARVAPGVRWRQLAWSNEGSPRPVDSGVSPPAGRAGPVLPRLR